MLLSLYHTSFVSKSSVKKYPGIGKIATAIDCVFLDRAGSKEEKIKAAEQIIERQKDNEKNHRTPIVIFPEGATTNNESVIKFKRGPFGGLCSVQPIGIKYWSLNGISPQNDTIGPYHFFFGMLSAATTMHIKIYPVFKPNDYFFEKHWRKDQGEEKWEAYARVVREHIIAKSFNFGLSDCQMEDKLDYKELIKGKTPKNKKEK